MAKILVVDDDNLMQDLLKQVLETEGYEVLVASDGREALDFFDAAPSDLVITDMAMPRMNGIELIRDLTDRDHDVKIIAMSGGGHLSAEDYLRIAQMLGARHTMSKPFEMHSFLNAVTEVLNYN